jgi:DNA-binding beta-propeller fold protein YncE
MDETTLRALLAQATDNEPPIGQLARNALQAGIRLRRRRRVAGAATSAAAVVVLATGVPALTGASGSPPRAGHPVKGMAYVATSAQTVVAINLATNTPVKVIKLPVPGTTQAMAITPDHKTVYTVSAQGEMTPISTATGKTGRPFRIGFDVRQILITPNGKSAYASEAKGVVLVSLTRHRELKLIRLPGAGGMAMTPDGRTVLVAVQSKTDEVVPILTATSRALSPIKLKAVGYAPDIVIGPGGKTAYVVAFGDFVVASSITPIDLVAGGALQPIMLPRQALADPYSFEITPNGKAGYVGGEDGVTAIDLVTRTVQKTIKLASTGSGFGYDVAISPDGRTAYASPFLKPRIIPIDLATNKALKPIGLGIPKWSPSSISFTPNGYAYIGRYYGYSPSKVKYQGVITVIRTSTGKVTKNIFLAGQPLQIVLAP